MSIIWQYAWQALFALVIVGALVTMIPIIAAFMKQVKLDKARIWFKETEIFEEQQSRLAAHEERILGTLVYWKNKAAAHHRLHSASVIWSLISAVSLPVLVQFYDANDTWSVAFLTAMTVFSGFVVALSHALKSEEMSRGFRECESDYYDCARALLDNPANTVDERNTQVDKFIETVRAIRMAGRKVETNRPPSGLNWP